MPMLELPEILVALRRRADESALPEWTECEEVHRGDKPMIALQTFIADREPSNTSVIE